MDFEEKLIKEYNQLKSREEVNSGQHIGIFAMQKVKYGKIHFICDETTQISC